MHTIIRPLEEREEPQALALWDRCFGPGDAYFRRYFSPADPWRRPGDTLGAWDGDRLVSAVHLCRRPVEWAGRTLVCGAIANVATDPDYRRQGLSREILGRFITRMERERIDFSMLFTSQFEHYAALGWEQVETPRLTLELRTALPSPDVDLQQWAPAEAPAELYWQSDPRPLRLHRPDSYHQGWVLWNWERWSARVFSHPDAGLLVLAPPEQGSGPRVLEWHALDTAGERALLLAAARAACDAAPTTLELNALPYDDGIEMLADLGEITPSREAHMMLRNVNLPADEYAEVKRAYAAGDAVWWKADGF